MTTMNILLATYNGESFLREQLDSLFKQSYQQWTLIIHDDNSTDNTVNIIYEYQTKYPNKITYIDDIKSFGSASGNFRFLVEKSKADYVMFCDQDDIWLSNKVALTLEKMYSLEATYPNKPLLIHTDLTVVDESLNTVADSYWNYQHLHPTFNRLNELLVQNVITGCTIMINQKLRTKALPIPDGVIMHDWWFGLVASSFGRIGYLNTSTILYRQHNNNDIGAVKFNIKTILHKAISLPKVNISKYIRQANLLLELYKDDLSPDQKLLLSNFVKIENSPWLKSKMILFKHKIFKQGMFRNIGLFISITSGNHKC